MTQPLPRGGHPGFRPQNFPGGIPLWVLEFNKLFCFRSGGVIPPLMGGAPCPRLLVPAHRLIPVLVEVTNCEQGLASLPPTRSALVHPTLVYTQPSFALVLVTPR